MGATQAKEGDKSDLTAFSPKELYNLKQVYFYLCLHTTTLTSCPLDRNQFHSLFGRHRQYKPLWRGLFNAIDLNADNNIDFEEFLTFVTHLKRGTAETKRLLCFRFFDSDRDGYVKRPDFGPLSEARAASLRKPSWQQAQPNEEDVEDEYTQFFTACDEDEDGKFNLTDFENYCLAHGERIVSQVLKLIEVMFDGVIEETGITITATDVKNAKPHIDWQDHKIGMSSLFCCSSQPPLFTTAPLA
eukprot:TRINITY_DN11875_c0_g1_i1.p3 TRINITY_DN11875_c0_g1~~TRINITY_DN11875_c0_g1_i1.p3  ORF type:complete len:244 (-),score=69.02 TRINITY_DN11875_c0_g1_i1:1474-2205(-)